MAVLEAAGYGDRISSYITYSGSAFQDAKVDLEGLIAQSDYQLFDWAREIYIFDKALLAGLLHYENQTDKDSIEEGISYYRDIYKHDPDRDLVKDSCSKEPTTHQSNPSIGGGGGSYLFFSPFVVGGSIKFPLFGSICDPGSDCYGERVGDQDPH